MKVLFVSSNQYAWGGSEELWARTAMAMRDTGIKVLVAKPNINRRALPLRVLAKRGVALVDLAGFGWLPAKMLNFLRFISPKSMLALHIVRLWWLLRWARPDFIVLSQGGNWDGIYFSALLRRGRVAYALICQKATDLYWPPDQYRPHLRALIDGAEHIYFVSQHNRALTEQQIGAALPRASVVRNPFLVDHTAALPWPAEPGSLRLACVGRLDAAEKGQDLLLRILAQPKWRARDLTVDFYGEGINAQGLKEMARFLGCDNVKFLGQAADIREVWRSHHALILASRAEGLPLVVIEAMLAGRVTIVSQAGGSAEVIEDGTSGFLMAGFDEAGLDNALERAWAARAEWEAIGLAAAAAIRELVPADPAKELAENLFAVAQVSWLDAKRAADGSKDSRNRSSVPRSQPGDDIPVAIATRFPE